MRSIRESSLLSGRFKERKSVLGSYGRFGSNMFKNTTMTPHHEMEYCVSMFNRNSLANAGVLTMKDFIKGGEIRVKSLDENSRKQVQEYLDDLNIDIWLDEVIENLIKTGNGYAELEPMDNGVIKKVYPISDSSRIYINCDEYGNPIKKTKLDNSKGELSSVSGYDTSEYYIQKIDPQYRIGGAKYYSLKYQFGSMWNQFQIYGVPIPKENMIHIKLGIGDIGVYGRSSLASTILDFETLEQIERSIAIIAKHKAVPRDIMRYGSDENPATDDELNDFILYLESLQKDESAIINKEFKRETLSYAGQDINLDYMIKHIKTKLTAGLAPEFAMGIGGEGGNKQTNQLTLLSYILSIYSKRKLIIKPITDTIIKPFVQAMGLKDCWLEFGELDFETKSEKTNRVGSMWTQNGITLNELRYQLGFPVLENGNVFFSQWQQLLLNWNVDNDNDPNNDTDDLKKSIQNSPDETDEPKGSAGANTVDPSQSLPNGDKTGDVFTHRDAPNKKTVQKGGRLPHDANRPTTKSPRLIKQKVEQNTYNELMGELTKLEKTITITIDDDEIKEPIKDNQTKHIQFDELMTKFSHIFNQPSTTEVFLKRLNNSYELSFNSLRNVMIVCEFTDEDIINFYGRDTHLSEQEQHLFVKGWFSQNLSRTIEVNN